jgi:hypothetical protein
VLDSIILQCECLYLLMVREAVSTASTKARKSTSTKRSTRPGELTRETYLYSLIPRRELMGIVSRGP